MTDDDTSDAAMIGSLVASSGGNIRTVIGDRTQVYQAIRTAWPDKAPPKFIIPPGKASISDKDEAHGGTEREWNAAEIALHRRMAWQRRHGYRKRSPVKTAISRIKRINGGSLTSRTFEAQKKETIIHMQIANRSMWIARPMSVRIR